jgi:5-methylcytosine-specific restriction endonuclease McrA
MKDALLDPLRHSIKEPIPAIIRAWELLSRAADAHISGNHAAAEALFRDANLSEVWHWTNPAWGPSPHVIRLNVRVWKPDGDTRTVPKTERDRRHPNPATEAAVLARDGYRCRYCGIPVVDASIRKIAHRLYPNAVPWIENDEHNQHAAFQCFWLQYDHVVPHSHGGSSSEDNVVVTCALCNYGKDQYTLRQLGISDPRLRPPEPVSWDGLERLRAFSPTTAPKALHLKVRQTPAQAPMTTRTPIRSSTFFLPGAWIRSEYLYTPPIDGKERWFKLGPKVIAEPAMRHGVSGCRLLCDPAQFRRRGLSPEAFLDTELSSLK